ncbi:TetR family transcriptional regulator [Nakamurella sp. YIM 132087]|uniref:TetR family transcriptional regulator n=1 Tax=Nakamurella alba TaxID=2665158 RepID=A0A7K1FTY6_9ACTN|nr:helix-turn-helix domain-containing protein [Nakamurella alba]MTD16284.1 TetR family transcriptional regulator [Nakamurella alba]
MEPADPDVARRRRGTVLEDAILEAALTELNEQGWNGFSMTRVAATAGTGKASLYRRWPDKQSLVQAAAARMAARGDVNRPELTGRLRYDLFQFLLGVATFLTGPFGQVVRGFVTDVDPAALSGPFVVDDRIAAVDAILAAAQRTGEFDGREIPVHAVNVGSNLVVHHFLVHGAVPDRRTIGEFVDTVWLPLLVPTPAVDRRRTS